MLLAPEHGIPLSVHVYMDIHTEYTHIHIYVAKLGSDRYPFYKSLV